jgi:hypothetical protein
MWKHLKRFSAWVAAAIFLTCACVGCTSRLALGAVTMVAAGPTGHSHPIARVIP